MSITQKITYAFLSLSALITVGGVLIFNIFNDIGEVTSALDLLNPASKNIQYIAHDINGYMLGHSEHREEFQKHRKELQMDWDLFEAHQVKHGGAPKDEQVLINTINESWSKFIKHIRELFDSYDQQQLDWLTADSLGDDLDKTISTESSPKNANVVMQKLDTLIQYMAHDVNAYLLGHKEHRQEFQIHHKEFSKIYETIDGNTKAHIQGLFNQYNNSALNLFDNFDKTQILWEECDELGDLLDQSIHGLVEKHNNEITELKAQSTTILSATLVLLILFVTVHSIVS